MYHYGAVGAIVRAFVKVVDKIYGCELAEQPSTNRQVWATINIHLLNYIYRDRYVSKWMLN